MAETIKDYKVRIKTDSNLAKLQKQQDRMKAFHKGQERSLKMQAMYSAMIKKNLAGLKAFNGSQPKGSPTTDKPYTTKPRKQDYDAHIKAHKKYLEEKKRLEDAYYKQQFKQSLGKQPSGAPKAKDTLFADMLKRESGVVGPELPKDRASAIKKEKAAELKATNDVAKSEARRLRNLQATKDTVLRTQFMLREQVSDAQKITQESIREDIAKAKTAKEVRDIYAINKARLTDSKIQNRELKKQNWLLGKMRASSQNLAANMVGAFAAVSGFQAIAETGRVFEGLENTMLSVSENTQDMGNNLAFVREEAQRLGIDLKQGSKYYARMLAGKGNLSTEQIQDLFSGLSEQATVLGLSAFEQESAFKAVAQMLSQGQVMADELKTQLAPVLPKAIELMAKAVQKAGISVSGTQAELRKLMETGKVISEDVMPHFAEMMSDAARENKALEKAVETNRTAQQRFTAAYQATADTIFKSGLGEGQKDFFETMVMFLRENTPLWQSLGRVINSIFQIVNVAVKGISVLLSGIGSFTNALTLGLEEYSAVAVPFFTALGWKLLPKVITGFRALAAAMWANPLMWKIAAVSAAVVGLVALLEEVGEFFAPTGKNTLLGFNINDVMKEIEKYMGWLLPRKMENDITKLDQNAVKNFDKGFAGSRYKQPVQVSGVIVMDGEKVGEIVADSNAVKSGFQQQYWDFSSPATE